MVRIIRVITVLCNSGAWEINNRMGGEEWGEWVWAQGEKHLVAVVLGCKNVWYLKILLSLYRGIISVTVQSGQVFTG